MRAQSIEVEPGGHAVHFYRDAAELADVVAGYLSDGDRERAALVTIVTEPHARAIEDAVGEAGTQADGRVTVLDARVTLTRLQVDGQISREAFQRVVGSVVREAGEGGRPVRAYGEMVDLLWQEGNITGAIELEELWNELIAELGFSLLCAYHSEAVAAPEHERALRDVCRLHTAVSSAREVSRRFRPDDVAPLAARRFLDETIARWADHSPRADDARLLVSELVTNAVVHAKSAMSVSISSERSKLRVAVHDESRVIPMPRPATPDLAVNGHGLRLVAALSSAWGVDLADDGKTVWAEL